MKEYSWGAAETGVSTVRKNRLPKRGAYRPDDVMSVETWVANEIVFVSDKEYTDPVNEADMDVVFTHTPSGKTLTRPAFWNGGREWIVRFALPDVGAWTFAAVCSDAGNRGLSGVSGSLTCTPYRGELAIYKHGFLRAEAGKKRFVYRDGTPFFYLGDTHWTLPMESVTEIPDVSEAEIAAKGITSQFHYIMEYRRAQGFTVIQSQPLSTYTGVTGNSFFGDAEKSIWTCGVDSLMLQKFRELDVRFRYIADLGFVHTSAVLTYPEELIKVAFRQEDFDWGQAEKLVRYWIARYGAYPVMWTTTQEGDKNLYGYCGCTAEENPWLRILDMTAAYDTYGNPVSCHQENFGVTRVKDSLFNQHSSHSWFAAQMYVFQDRHTLILSENFKEYYASPKPVVNYEGHYDHFWTGTAGARAQAWVSYLSGVCGFGYGMQPIWSLSWAGNDSTVVQTQFGDEYTKNVAWYEGLTADGGVHMSYIAAFFSEIAWDTLVPTFGENAYYKGNQLSGTVATDGNELYVGYFYGADDCLGTLMGMEDCDYRIRFFNPRTGEWTGGERIRPENGQYSLRGKPDGQDWVVCVGKENRIPDAR